MMRYLKITFRQLSTLANNCSYIRGQIQTAGRSATGCCEHRRISEEATRSVRKHPKPKIAKVAHGLQSERDAGAPGGFEPLTYWLRKIIILFPICLNLKEPAKNRADEVKSEWYL
jgi:hypothetical protein